MIKRHSHTQKSLQNRSNCRLSILFTAVVILPAILLLSGCCDRNYSIVILGDTHFDAEPETVYHSCYHEETEWLNRVQRAEFARNGEMWRERCPRMLERASRLVSDDTKMIFQMGDLIQGDCGDPEVHAKMLDDVLNSFKATLGGLPFITAEGNHDMRGTGATEVYHSYMPGRMSEELGQKIDKTTFSFMIGPDAYIVIDFNHPDVEEIRNSLHRTEGARYTFVITHGPVFPYDAATCRWFLFGNINDSGYRLEFRKLFAERNVICLCGHTHRIELMDWAGDGGRITQMTMNSVWANESLADLNVKYTDPSSYGEYLNGLKNADGSPVKDESQLFEEYRSGISRYFVSDGAGSFKMHVSSKGVTIDFFGGDSEKITRSFTLR